MHLDSSSSAPEKQLASRGFVQESSVASGLASGPILLTPSLPEWLPLPSLIGSSPPMWWGRALLKSLLAGCSGGVSTLVV